MSELNRNGPQAGWAMFTDLVDRSSLAQTQKIKKSFNTLIILISIRHFDYFDHVSDFDSSA